MLSAFWQVLQMGAAKVQADLILIDIGPNLGALNRSALIASDFVVIPLGTDLFSIQGLKNLGPALRGWVQSWNKRLNNWNNSPESGDYPSFNLPNGKMRAVGYICQQVGVRLDRPPLAYEKWAGRIPKIYRTAILNEDFEGDMPPADDPYCLATIKHYRSLVPMGQEHNKPIFYLTAADGAIGSHANAARDAKKEFQALAAKIIEKCEFHNPLLF